MDVDVVSFRLPGHGHTAMSNMNSLRTQHHFCDVTIMAGGKRMFRGHKVVLAACSAFLRDQFLLNPSSELQQVSVLHSSQVVCELLQSCYTGMLQFSAKEIVNYLTAASYLQMEHVVEKCRGALSQYMQPRNHSPMIVKTEDPQSMPVIVSGSTHSLGSVSPPSDTASLHPHSSGRDIQATKAEHYRDASDLSMHHVRTSDPSGHFEDGSESDVFQVQISDEHQDPEKNPCAEEVKREAVDMLHDHCQELDTGAEEHNIEGRGKGNTLRGPVRTWRRRHGEHRGGRGRGFKSRRRYTIKDRKLLGNYQEAWRFPTPDEIMGNFEAGFGADYMSNQHLADGSLHMEYRVGEGQDEGGTDGGPAHFGVEASSGEEAMGVGAQSNEHGAADESVAVVGSTSCVAGPVVCEDCGLAFSTTQDLAMHSLATHQLYVCPCCGKNFSHASNLNRHMVIHRGVAKLHCCPLCHKTFTQKSTLCDHMNLHSGERPHICAYCHVSFAHRPALRRHLKEQHGKTTAQNHLEMQQNNESAAGGVGGRV